MLLLVNSETVLNVIQFNINSGTWELGGYLGTISYLSSVDAPFGRVLKRQHLKKGIEQLDMIRIWCSVFDKQNSQQT